MELKTGEDTDTFSKFVLILIKLRIIKMKNWTWNEVRRSKTFKADVTKNNYGIPGIRFMWDI